MNGFLRIILVGEMKTNFLGNPNFVYAVLRNKKRFEGKPHLDENVSSS
jgi:hypothetical protein